MSSILVKDVDGLNARYEYDRSAYAFDTADWTAAAGASLSLSSSKLRVGITGGGTAKRVIHDNEDAVTEGMVHVAMDASVGSGQNPGILNMAATVVHATRDDIYATIPLGFSGTRVLGDSDGAGTATTISSTGSINHPTANVWRGTSWGDGTNAAFYDHVGDATESGAQNYTPHNGKGGFLVFSTPANTLDIERYFSMKGRYIELSGLTSGQIARLYSFGPTNGYSIISTDTATGDGLATLDALKGEYPWVVLAVFESDGTTLVAAVEDCFGGDEYVLTAGATDLSIVNPGAESGNMTGWTDDGKSPTTSALGSDPHTGSWSFLPNSPLVDESFSYQDVAIPVGWQAAVDSGGISATFSYWITSTGTSGCQSRAWIAFYNSVPTLISTADTADLESNTVIAYFPRGQTVEIPTTTRYIRVVLWGARGTAQNKRLDDVALSLISTGPLAPTVTVTDVQANQVTVTGSAFVAGPGGGTHVSTNYYIRKTSDDSLVVSKLASSDLLTTNMGPTLDGTSQYAQMEYVDSDGLTGEAGTSAPFTTTNQSSCFRDGSIDDEDIGLTKIGLLSPDVYGSYLPIGNALDNKLITYYWGSVVAPRGLLLNECTPHVDAFVRVKGGFDGEVASGYPATPLPVGLYGYTWGKYWSIEFNGLGAWALAGGEYGNASDPLHGVFAFLRIGVPWPYGTCSSVPAKIGQTGAVAANTSTFEVQVWENDNKVKSVIVAAGAEIQAVNRACGIFTEYGIRLQVVRDLVGDPTGKTWDIKAQWEEDAIPDGTTWLTEFSYTSSVLSCGLGGLGTFNLPGAAGGAAGAVFVSEFYTDNLSDYCNPPTPVPAETNPTAVAAANCGFITASASGWSGAAVGPITQAKWDFRLNADSSLLYTTGWQTDFLQYIQINMYDHPEIPFGTSIDVQVTFKDADGTTSVITPIATVTTGEPPDTPTLVLKGIFLNRIIVIAGPFSSDDATATHEETTLSVFLASDTEFETPLVTDTWRTPETLTGELTLEYDFDLSVSYAARIIYTDQYGCTSTALTSTEALEDDEEIDDVTPPNKICPLYAACDVGSEGAWVTCDLTGEAAWVPCDLTGEATWDGTCINNC